MDRSLYNTHITSRGITYSYYFSPAKDGKQTLLFLHGFPSTSEDWHKQVPYFTKRGYGALVPDMLGYGGTDKPTLDELEKFKPSLIAKDMVELLENEKVGSTISIGHDWGSMSNSRVAQLYSDRFDGFGFLALGYMPPSPDFEIHKANAMTKEKFGYEVLGYQIYSSEPDTAHMIETHWDSYFSLVFPADPTLWKSVTGPSGGMKAWLEADRQGPLPSYIDAKEKQRITDALLKRGGFRSPLLWYNLTTSGMRAADDKTIPESSYSIKKPVFLGAAAKDYICVADMQIANAERLCPQLTVKKYDGDHWILWSHADQLNPDLLAWVEGLTKKSAL